MLLCVSISLCGCEQNISKAFSQSISFLVVAFLVSYGLSDSTLKELPWGKGVHVCVRGG